MDSSLMKPVTSSVEILTIFKRGSPYGCQIFQTDHQMYPGPIECSIEIIHDSNCFIIRSKDFSLIDNRHDLYVRLHYRKISFRLKPSEFMIQDEGIFCKYPKELIGLMERHDGDRYLIPNHSDISLSLKRVEKSLRETTYPMELRILDVSQKGFGIYISSKNSDYLKQNDVFWLTSVDQTLLRRPIYGHVSYVTQCGRTKGNVRVGLCLSSPLWIETFDYLKRRSQMILCA